MSDSDALWELAAGHGGVYRLGLPVKTGPPVEAMLADEGWRVAVVAEVSRTRDFYAALRTALDLPEWTGSNLDALWDVLTDLREPTALVWRGADSYAVARPQRWSQLLEVLTERSTQDPPFAVVLA